MAKILPNLPIDKLTKENDYIGILTKGDIIKNFFLSHKHDFNRVKFFALYGEWGSGKSSLMKYLEEELKGSFNAFFFEAWEYESDHNLPKSLLEFLHYKSGTKVDDVFKNGTKLLEGFARSITFKTPIFNINSNKIIESVEENSFFELKQRFKEDFESWENKITECDKCPKYNIVFIDDLDRCEPENVLNLLSAIKLFFTYGKKTIFLCGIDKKAVDEAVKTKYKDVIKANEYLEKVFDLTFSMPKENSIEQLISYYFDGNYTDSNGQKVNLPKHIANFFWILKFENPRRIKKILNKYKLIESLRENLFIGYDLPDLIMKKGGTLFETILTLYLLILKEFEPSIFNDFLNLSLKKEIINRSLYKVDLMTDALNSKGAFSEYPKLKEYNFDIDINMTAFANRDKEFKLSHLIFLFFPNNITSVGNAAFDSFEDFQLYTHVNEKKIDYYFVEYLFRFPVFQQDTYTYSFLDYKRMIINLI
ncbi:P-loop NTPase fold protein [uncultured Tenacibaculum sp.]|uniref:KAP family P-loop NTPase fold protein n=1 Tax=uncultured Tenacibaculum sp. TaxID=174713 RepID=UPI002616359F|nr:P-loop NTPase fold protein [uncultured Tenacibaculum sp.]